MSWKTPRWLWILEGMLLVASLAVLGYKAAMWVAPLPPVRIELKPDRPKAAARPTIMDYYHQYPDRYIRVENETWEFNTDSQIATHSFSLRNLATVAYQDIEVRFTYENGSGTVLLVRDVKIPGILKAQDGMSVRKIRVAGVPFATRTVVAVVAKAVVVP